MNKPVSIMTFDSSTADFSPEETPIAPQAQEVISCYFETLNAEDFQATANLFAEAGRLYPPFESAVMGREAIVAYLDAEARGLKLFPLKCTAGLPEENPVPSGMMQYRVIGKVQTSLFNVNVAWRFMLNHAAEIVSVRVKLLAALEELLKLRSES